MMSEAPRMSANLPAGPAKPMLSVCQIVLYTLSENDAAKINADRSNRDVVANLAEAGQSFPAVVVRTFGGQACNLKVLLDGPDSYWATSRSEGDSALEPGTWCWPPRA